MKQPPQVLSKEDLEKHRRLLQDIDTVLTTESGRRFIKYLFDAFGVGEIPLEGLKGDELIEAAHHFRTGQHFYRLIVQANPLMATTLLTEIEKERINVLEIEDEPINRD